MKTFTEIIGNPYTDPAWAEKVEHFTIEHLFLDQWTAQKSRFIVKSDLGEMYGVALKRHHKITHGDLLEYDPIQRKAVMIQIELKPVMVIDLHKITHKSPEEILRQGIELGHALGNQHWPAIVKGSKILVPLTVDQKVMQSVLDTHHFENVSYTFLAGQEVIPFLAPHEIRALFGGAFQPHNHTHHES